ncbi:MAG: potassium-transporting ATPase subunit KdpC [Planctomycetes bacterium]|nr:potassium-transporting ATPase subunit KdpC [Planctomycetota bacterium]
MFTLLSAALRVLLALSLLCGIVYPALVLGLAQLAFPVQANGSLIERDGRAVGSRLIGQPFHSSRYFWSRPSATGVHAYDARASSGSNLGPTSPALLDAVAGRVRDLRASVSSEAPVPVDLVTTSASGLDPHISPAAALLQVERVATARGLAPERVRALVLDHVEPRTIGLLGEARVNVLELDLALDELR